MRVSRRWAIAACLAVAACNADRLVQQSKPTVGRMSPTRSAGSTDLAVGTYPLRAALYRSDSASVPVNLASVDLIVAAGDTLALLASGDDSVFAGVGSKVQVTVTINGSRKSYSMDQLRDGVTVARWTAPDTIHVTYQLSRSVARALGGAFRLSQETRAQVTGIKASWAGNRARGLSLYSAMGNGTNCSLDGQVYPTGPCGSGTYTIDPWGPAAAFCCFQAAPGTGQSQPMDITFSKPVSSITLTIEDPTYAGNTMTAYAPNGSVVGTVAFAFSGQPGNNQPQTTTMTGNIARVHLDAPTGDYVVYNGYAEINHISLQCDRTRLTRADQISCSVNRPTNQVISSWRFEPKDPALGPPIPRTDPDLTTPWWGLMVTDGKMIVESTSSNEADTSDISIFDRNWGAGQLAYNPVPGAGDKTDLGINHAALVCSPLAGTAWPPIPFQTTLGESCADVPLPFAITMSDYFGLLQTGPNAGLSYATSIPGRLKIWTSVNLVALAQGSAFWKLQPAQPGPSGGQWGTWCGQDWVANRGPMTGIHEGVGATPDPNSHAGNLPGLWGQFYVRPIEKLVKRGYPGTPDIVAIRDKAKNSAAFQSSLDTDDQNAGWSWTIKCDLKWS